MKASRDVEKLIISPRKTFIIAEAGVNHNGDKVLAKELIAAASQSGADAVKFQTFVAKRVISKYAKKAKYQITPGKDRQSQLSMLTKLELSDEDYERLYSYAKKQKIVFLSTPKDIASAKLLEGIGVAIYKIGSSEINNLEFLKFVAGLKKPILLSTGMSAIGEVKEAVDIIRAEGNPSVILLHCVSEYPCPIGQVNLKAMLTMRDIFKLPVGYSDHTLGVEVVLAAVALGATVIEKHFTLNKKMKGPDHKISLAPAEFKNMALLIRNIEKSMGDGVKKPALCEIKNRKLLRRSLVFARNLSKGTLIGLDDIAVKRPGTGLEPKYRSLLINKKLKRDVAEDQLVRLGMFYK